jgi:hypothetical protein
LAAPHPSDAAAPAHDRTERKCCANSVRSVRGVRNPEHPHTSPPAPLCGYVRHYCSHTAVSIFPAALSVFHTAFGIVSYMNLALTFLCFFVVRFATLCIIRVDGCVL